MVDQKGLVLIQDALVYKVVELFLADVVVNLFSIEMALDNIHDVSAEKVKLLPVLLVPIPLCFDHREVVVVRATNEVISLLRFRLPVFFVLPYYFLLLRVVWLIDVTADLFIMDRL